VAGATSSHAAAPSAPAATPSQGAGGVPACTTNDLKITAGVGPGGGTAGSVYATIGFTNTSKAQCTLEGYPGVSLTDRQFAQIGAAATRSAASAPSTVTLAPGATGDALLRIIDATAYSASQCGLETSAYLMVYPPNQTESYQIPYQTATCSKSSVKTLSIGAVTSGT
jgi:hypothetical protein